MDGDKLEERIERRVYLPVPQEEEDYDAASKPLTGKSPPQPKLQIVLIICVLFRCDRVILV